MVRKAADLTQVELAKELGVTQGAVAKLEGRHDLLLSTLKAYTEGVGARLYLLIEFEDGREVELDLDNVGEA
jgi:predicted transcriptional regulator